METLKSNLLKFATVDNIIDLVTSGLAGLVVLGVAFMGIVLSYNALYDLAHLSAVIHPNLTWLWPFMLDSVAVGASIFILWSEWRQQPARYAWGLLIGFTIASVIFNTLHANYEALVTWPYVAGIISSFVAGLPPIAAALTLHLFVVLLRDILERLSLVATVARLRGEQSDLASRRDELLNELDKLAGKVDDLTTQLHNMRAEKRKIRANEPVRKRPNELSPEERLANLQAANDARQPTQADYNYAKWLKDGQGMTWPEVAEEIDRSESTAKRWADMAESWEIVKAQYGPVNEPAAVHTNGKGA